VNRPGTIEIIESHLSSALAGSSVSDSSLGRVDDDLLRVLA